MSTAQALSGWLPYAVATWLLLWGLYGVVTSRHLVHLVVCLAVVQSSTYLLLLAVGDARGGAAPVFVSEVRGAVVDPVVQALMLTDVVVEATVLALLLALVVRIHEKAHTIRPDRLVRLKG